MGGQSSKTTKLFRAGAEAYLVHRQKREEGAHFIEKTKAAWSAFSKGLNFKAEEVCEVFQNLASHEFSTPDIEHYLCAQLSNLTYHVGSATVEIRDAREASGQAAIWSNEKPSEGQKELTYVTGKASLSTPIDQFYKKQDHEPVHVRLGDHFQGALDGWIKKRHLTLSQSQPDEIVRAEGAIETVLSTDSGPLKRDGLVKVKYASALVTGSLRVSVSLTILEIKGQNCNLELAVRAVEQSLSESKTADLEWTVELESSLQESSKNAIVVAILFNQGWTDGKFRDPPSRQRLLADLRERAAAIDSLATDESDDHIQLAMDVLTGSPKVQDMWISSFENVLPQEASGDPLLNSLLAKHGWSDGRFKQSPKPDYKTLLADLTRAREFLAAAPKIRLAIDAVQASLARAGEQDLEWSSSLSLQLRTASRDPVVNSILTQHGWTDNHFEGPLDRQGLLQNLVEASKETVMFLAWAGTDVQKRVMDVFTDFSAVPVACGEWNDSLPELFAHSGILGQVQHGFIKFKEVVKRRLKDFRCTKLIFTGHSLGGGCAMLAHMMALHCDVPDVHCHSVVFAAPMVFYDASSSRKLHGADLNEESVSMLETAVQVVEGQSSEDSDMLSACLAEVSKDPVVQSILSKHGWKDSKFQYSLVPEQLKNDFKRALVAQRFLQEFHDNSINYIVGHDVVPRLPGHPGYFKPCILEMVKSFLLNQAPVLQTPVVAGEVTKLLHLYVDQDALEATYSELQGFMHLSTLLYYPASTALDGTIGTPEYISNRQFVEKQFDPIVSTAPHLRHQYYIHCHLIMPRELKFAASTQ